MKGPTLWRELPARALALSGGITMLSLVYFMIIPLLALYMSEKLHTGTARIGVVLAVLGLANQGLQVVVGIAADRLGIRPVLTAGIAVACVGFVLMALGPSYWAQLVAAFALGLGTAATSVLGKALLIQAAGPHRMSALAVRAASVNAGAALGPVIGAALFGVFGLALGVTAVVYAVFWFVLVRPLPVGGAGGGPSAESAASAGRVPHAGADGVLRGLFGNGALVGLALASVGYWLLYTQLTFTFPLYANDRFGLSNRVGLFFTLEAVIAIVAQYPIIRWLNAHTDAWRILSLGCLVLCAAFAVLAAVPHEGALVVFIVLFAFGALMMGPTLDLLATRLTGDGPSVAGALGVASLGWATGGLLGNLVGGVGYSAARHARDWSVFWYVAAAIGAGSALTFAVMRRAHPLPPAAGGPSTQPVDGTARGS